MASGRNLRVWLEYTAKFLIFTHLKMIPASEGSSY